MTRLSTQRSDNLTALQETSDVMFSAYTNDDENELVLVAANLTNEAREITLNLKNASDKNLKNQSVYLTDTYTNLTRQEADWAAEQIIVPAKSILTYTAEVSNITGVKNNQTEPVNMTAFYRPAQQDIKVRFNNAEKFQTVRLVDITGKLLYENSVKGKFETNIRSQHLEKGIYIVIANGYNTIESKKIIIR